MSRGPHLFRRGAVYYWQRRLPNHLARALRIDVVKVSLGTKDLGMARRLVAPLDACAMEMFMGQTQALSREQLGGIFKAVLVEHKAKLALIADCERARPTAERRVHIDNELAQGAAYRLLAEQGADARLTPAHQQQLVDEGRDTAFLIKIIENLEALRGEDGIKISQRRLAGHIQQAGAEPNAVSMARAQPVYLRALGEALLAAEERYGDQPQDELDFAALMAETTVQASPPVAETAPPKPAPTREPSPVPTPAPPAAASSIALLGEAYQARCSQDGDWNDKTCRQARFIFTLFARFMRETRAIEDFGAVEQNDLARFDTFLRGLHNNFGKSTKKDPTRTIVEILALAEIEVPKHGAIQGPTRNRHLTFLNQLIDYARGQGLAIDPKLSTTPFRTRRKVRGRGQRPVPPKSAVEALFQRPVFIGYAGWDDIDTPGTEFFHRAEFYCPILANYEGARREEYCGLDVVDIICDNGPIPYIHIAPNEFRRIKNEQSVRNVPLHPELIRLGFLDYVEAIKALGYRRLFPDLYSPSTRSPLGDRLYDQMLPSLKAAGLTSHQIRHFFGDELKQRAVSKEHRADLLGHGGDSETTERYCNPLALEQQLPHLLKLPIVTAHLEPRPIRLLPWIIGKEIAPWSKAAKARRSNRNGEGAA